MVRALFPRLNLSVLRLGRFGGGRKLGQPGLPLLDTHFARRTTRIDDVGRGVHIATKSEGRASVLTLAVQHLPSKYDMAISSNCSHKIHKKYV